MNDIEGSFQMIPVNLKSEKPIDVKNFHKIHIKRHCIDGSIVNGIREPIAYTFGLDEPPCRKTYEGPTRIRLFKKINKSVLSHITFV